MEQGHELATKADIKADLQSLESRLRADLASKADLEIMHKTLNHKIDNVAAELSMKSV